MREQLVSGNELSFAVEGRFTNVRVWLSAGLIYMRLDCYKQYSCPLKACTLQRLNKPSKPVMKLAQFGFESPINQLDSLLSILESMKQRPTLAW